MLVELRSLRPNPLRDFTIDPIDDAKVEDLKQSIKQDGFWSGVVARTNNSHIEIAAGHHRVKAALAAGIREADIHVIDDLDDAGMVRIYARENATQRGNSGTAIAGTVASAVRYAAKAIFTGVGLTEEFFGDLDVDKMRRHLTGERGVGRDSILALLKNVPGINDGVVQQQLANLKASGDYARLIDGVRQQIEHEQREALKALAKAEAEHAVAEAKEKEAEERRKKAAIAAKAAREDADRKRTELERQRAEAEAKLAEKRRAEAEKDLAQFDALRQTRDSARAAADKSAEQEKTFDFEGVAALMNNAHHIDVFRQVVTGKVMREYLPVTGQAALAKKLVASAKAQDRELTGAFIREQITTLLLGTKQVERRMSNEDKEAARRNDFILKKRQYEHDFLQGLAIIARSGQALNELLQRWPKGLPLTMNAEFRIRVERTQKLLARLLDKL